MGGETKWKQWTTVEGKTKHKVVGKTVLLQLFYSFSGANFYIKQKKNQNRKIKTQNLASNNFS